MFFYFSFAEEKCFATMVSKACSLSEITWCTMKTLKRPFVYTDYRSLKPNIPRCYIKRGEGRKIKGGGIPADTAVLLPDNSVTIYVSVCFIFGPHAR